MRANSAFTLIEALVLLAIVAVLYGVSSSSLDNYIQKIRTQSELNQLQQLLSAGRHYAITQGKRVRICPLSSANACHPDWNQAVFLFEDMNNNSRLDPGENIIQQLQAINTANSVRAFNNQNYISFSPQGFSGYTVGSLSYCSQGKHQQGGVLIISRTGRVRMAFSHHQHGLPKLANGQPIPC